MRTCLAGCITLPQSHHRTVGRIAIKDIRPGAERVSIPNARRTVGSTPLGAPKTAVAELSAGAGRGSGDEQAKRQLEVQRLVRGSRLAADPRVLALVGAEACVHASRLETMCLNWRRSCAPCAGWSCSTDDGQPSAARSTPRSTVVREREAWPSPRANGRCLLFAFHFSSWSELVAVTAVGACRQAAVTAGTNPSLLAQSNLG